MLVFMKKASYVCVRFCCTDWLGNSSIIIENRVSFVLSNGGPRLRVALESRWITKDRSPQILYSRSFVVLFCTAKLFCIFGPPSSGPKCLDAACYCCSFFLVFSSSFRAHQQKIGAQRKKLRDISYDDMGMRINISLIFFNTTYP